MKRIKWLSAAIVLLLAIGHLVYCSDGQQPSHRVGGRKHRHAEVHRFRKVRPGADVQFFYLPIPPSNDYQQISNVDAHGGEIFTNPNSPQQYVRYTIAPSADANDWIEAILEFDYVPTATEFETQEITDIHPYDTTTELYKRYTARYYEFLDIDHPAMREASDRLWAASADVYDYARKCFQYVRDTFEFKDVGTGWYTTSELIAKNGGDCGNLSSLFITLLRCKGVPARHVILPGHAWAEFYLEEYGWVPVDPTLGLFGQASSSYRRLIWSHEIVFYCETSADDTFRSLALSQHHVFYPSHEPYECDVRATQRRLD